MSFKNILVSLNDVDNVANLLSLARGLAQKFTGRVTGLYLLPPEQKFRTTAYVNAPGPIETSRTFFEKHESAVCQKFDHFVLKQGVHGEILVRETDLQFVLKGTLEEGRMADLVIVASTQGHMARGYENDFVEQLVLQSGRPILVMPSGSDKPLNLDDIVVAWDHGREAARAVADAMPFLKVAKSVHVVMIDAAKHEEALGAKLVENLRHQGVKANFHAIASGGETTGRALMLSAEHHRAGLVVMGCYGHSRFAELVLGGTTRQVVGAQDRPILMSH